MKHAQGLMTKLSGPNRSASDGGAAARGLHASEVARDKGGAWELLWWPDFQGWVAFFEAILTLVSPEKNDWRWRQMADETRSDANLKTEVS